MIKPYLAKYNYTIKNLLKHPCKYQYSKYEGKYLFYTFHNDRNSAMKKLNKKLNKAQNNINIKFTRPSIITLKEKSYVLNPLIQDMIIYFQKT